MRLNTATQTAPIFTHEGGRATPTDSFHSLKRSVLTCLLWEDSFYEKGSEIADRIADLVPRVKPEQVAALAAEARDRMHLRHIPLFLLSELSKVKGTGGLISETLSHVIQRADELSEFLAIYWKNGRHPLSAGVKRGLARAFGKFDAYRLAKYNRDSAIKLRDVLFLTHPKPKDADQAELWKSLVAGTLPSPDTWEVELSAGKDKKLVFERLLTEGKLGGLAVLRNLRNMLKAGVSEGLIRERLAQGAARAFPYRFVVAAKYAPQIEDAIEAAMFRSVEEMEVFRGRIGLLIDVSGSMNAPLDQRSETTRIDVAAGLAILLRQKADLCQIATFSREVIEIPSRRGFALRDAIENSQEHTSTFLRAALEKLKPLWHDINRLIVITDEQSQDGISAPWLSRSWIINVAPNRNGVSYRNGWNHVDGFSERILDYIREIEQYDSSTESQNNGDNYLDSF
jgi:60 kDa SS-A/Ro ribonucleoprotein